MTLHIFKREACTPDMLLSDATKSLTVPVWATDTQYLTGKAASSSPWSLISTIPKSSFDTLGISSVM
jgi:hypothetical protein